MPTIKWTTENEAWVDGNDVGEAVQEILRHNGFRCTSNTTLSGPILIEKDAKW